MVLVLSEYKEQVSNLFQDLKSRTKRFALAVICIVDSVPANQEIVSGTEVLSAWNHQQQVCVMRVAGFHSSRVGNHFESKSAPAGTAENEKNQVKVWLLNVLCQAGWQEYNSEEGNHYHANASLRLHQWEPPCVIEPLLNPAETLYQPPQPLLLQMPPCVIEPTLNPACSLHQMLSKHPCDTWKIELPMDTSGTMRNIGSFRCIILTDSTIMLPYCGHHLVKYDQELLGLAVGGYGCAFFDGAFDHLKDWIKAAKGSPHPRELVVAYVPAEDFKDYSYDEHAYHQTLNLGRT